VSKPKLFEELLLMQAYRDTYRRGKPTGSGIPVRFQGGAGHDILPAAVLAELALADRIRVEQADPEGRLEPSKDTLVVTDPTPLGDVEADAMLDDVASRRYAKVESAVSMIGIPSTQPPWKAQADQRRRILDRLAEQGALRVYQRKLLGIFPARSYPITDPTPATDAVARLDGLLHGAEPDRRTGVLALFVLGPGRIRPVGECLDTARGERATLEELRQKLYDSEWAEKSLRLTISDLVALTARHGDTWRHA
jgi:hypothetical protein